MGIEQWKIKTLRKNNKRVTIADALLGQKWGAYFFYRLRFFYMNTLISHLLHVVELTILASIFKPEHFYSFAMLKIGLGTLSQFVWGYLEGFRDDIRDLASSGSYHLIDELILYWLKKSYQVCIGFGVFCFLSILTLNYFQRLTPDPLFVTLLSLYLIKAVINIPIQTFHSGVYSVTRIYRPLWSMLIFELSGIVSLLILWPFIGKYSLAASVTISIVIGASTMLFYTRKAYLSSILQSTDKNNHSQANHLVFKKKNFESATAYSFMTCDILLILLFFKFSPQFEFSSEINELYLIILIFPIIHAGYSWVRLMYFDLIKFRAHLFKNLNKMFLSQIYRLSIFIGLVLSGIALVTAALVIKKPLGTYYFALPIFIVTRSFFSITKMNLFINKRYNVIIGLGIMVILSQLLLIQIDEVSPYKLLTFTLVLLFFSFVSLYLNKNAQPINRITNEAQFLKRILGKKNTYPRIVIIRFDQEANKNENQNIVDWAKSNLWLHQKILDKLTKKINTSITTLKFPGEILLALEHKHKHVNCDFFIQELVGLSSNVQIIENNSIIENMIYRKKSIDLRNKDTIDGLVKYFNQTIPDGSVICVGKDKQVSRDLNLSVVLSKSIKYSKYLSYHSTDSEVVDTLTSEDKLMYAFIYKRKEKGARKWQKKSILQTFIHTNFFFIL